MSKERDTLIAWLRDAQAMEGQAMSLLEHQLARLASYPELSARLEEHLEGTRRQQRELEGCLEELGADTSLLKEGFAKFMGNVMSIGPAASSDEMVKNLLTSYAFESFEIASYKSLAAAAQRAGQARVRQVALSLLTEEQAMAAWLGERIEPLTDAFLSRQESGERAKT
jgi:ferritin-like metal-binding protein YciE